LHEKILEMSKVVAREEPRNEPSGCTRRASQ
jgi:hypothetical protein